VLSRDYNVGGIIMKKRSIQKKAIGIITMCFILLSSTTITGSAINLMAEPTQQPSIAEMLQNLVLINHPDEIAAVVEGNEERLTGNINIALEWETRGAIRSLEDLERIHGDNVPERLQGIVDRETLRWSIRPESNFAITPVITNRFALQFARNSTFYQLISHDEASWVQYQTRGEIPDFLRDIETMEEMIRQATDERIIDIRYVYVASVRILYLRGEYTDFAILIFDNINTRRTPLPNGIQFFQIHPLVDILENLVEFHARHNWIGHTNVMTTKPTFTQQAQHLHNQGLLLGDERGLDLLRPLNRIEATTVLIRALGLENEETSQISHFTDIPDDNWGRHYANIAADHNIAQGVGYSMFAPNTLITADQFATLVLRASGNFGNFDWQDGISILIDNNIITAEDAETMDLFTRGDMAKIIYEAIAHGLFGE